MSTLQISQVFQRPLCSRMFRRFILGALGTIALVASSISAFAQVPLITESVYPASVAPGHPQLNLYIKGNGFTSASIANWNGSPLRTIFVSSHQVTAVVPASLLAKPSTASITVSNPNAGLSNTIYFPVVTAITQLSLSSTDYTLGNGPVQGVTGDFNHDGKLDVAVINYVDGTVSVMLGHGDGTFAVLPPFSPFPPNVLLSMAIGDFDGDGNEDIAILTGGVAPVAAILMSNGDGTFTVGPPTKVRVDPHVNPAQIVAGDFNGDGKLDVAISDQQGEHVMVLKGNGKGALGLPQLTNMKAPGFNPVWMAVGDFNGDGKLDIAVTEPLAGYLSILLGHGDGYFSESLIPFPAGNSPNQVLAADLNHDGKVDLVVTNGGNIFVFLGKGDGTFHALPKFPVPQEAGAITLGDFNGDGKLDLAAIFRNHMSIMAGNGNGTFQTPQVFDVPQDSEWITAGDFNNDGRLDFLGLVTGGSTAGIYLQLP